MEKYSWEFRFVFPWETYDGLKNNIINYLYDSQRIIDIGFGSGYILKELRKTYPEKKIIGLEIKPRRIKSEIYSICGSIESLSFRDDSFDGAVCTFVLDYVNRQKSIDEIKRILRKNGKAVLCFHPPESGILNAMKKKLKKNPEDKDLSYFVSTLESNIFKNREEFVRFMENSMLIDSLESYTDVAKDGSRYMICYVAYLRNKDPIWNFISEPVVK